VIAVVGSVNMDLSVRTPRVPSRGENLLAHGLNVGLGGKGANPAVAISRMGGRASFVGCVGDDGFGRQAREALELLRQKAIKGLSIGFESIKEAFEGTVRVLSEIKLWEVSVVTFPANDRATVTVVKAVVPFQDLPLADRDREWSARTAERRVRAWADAEDGLDTAAKREKYRQAFVWYDSEDAENFGAYKLPIADVLDGRLTAVPRAIFAAAAAIEGARGGVDIPEADAAKVRTHLGRYYSKMDLTAPWDAERQAANAVAAAIGWATLGVRIDPAMAQSAIDALAPLAQEGKEGQADPGAALSDWLPPAPPGAGESDERQKQAILDAVAQYTAATGN